MQAYGADRRKEVRAAASMDQNKNRRSKFNKRFLLNSIYILPFILWLSMSHNLYIIIVRCFRSHFLLILHLASSLLCECLDDRSRILTESLCTIRSSGHSNDTCFIWTLILLARMLSVHLKFKDFVRPGQEKKRWGSVAEPSQIIITFTCEKQYSSRASKLRRRQKRER